MNNFDELQRKLIEKTKLDAEISNLAKLVYYEIPESCRDSGEPESAEFDTWNSNECVFLIRCGGDEYSSIGIPKDVVNVGEYFLLKKKLEEEKATQEKINRELAENKRLRAVYENLKKRFE